MVLELDESGLFVHNIKDKVVYWAFYVRREFLYIYETSSSHCRQTERGQVDPV